MLDIIVANLPWRLLYTYHLASLSLKHPACDAKADRSHCVPAPAVASPPAELPAEIATPPSMQGLADTYAVVDIGGVQHIVEEGRWYTCNRLAVGSVCCSSRRDSGQWAVCCLEHWLLARAMGSL